jgi:hypothetical protein
VSADLKISGIYFVVREKLEISGILYKERILVRDVRDFL